MSGHQRPHEGETNEWLTPPEIVTALGPFDLDPCSPIVRPWDTAKQHLTIEDDGLATPWDGLVWMNPPYGPHTEKWLRKLADHGQGIALIFARTETKMFQEQVFGRGSTRGILFLRSRLHFHRPDGARAPFNAGAPSCLVAYGRTALNRLYDCGLMGTLVTSWSLS